MNKRGIREDGQAEVSPDSLLPPAFALGAYWAFSPKFILLSRSQALLQVLDLASTPSLTLLWEHISSDLYDWFNGDHRI
ncbi:hypothetical protein PM082_022492 [Marasmius tenuissimus]|nr:hypothetical protein PM082_022492 [Marasmius tenuissimus]